VNLFWDHLLVQNTHDPNLVAAQSIKPNMLPMFVPAKIRADSIAGPPNA
jgi:hypothetical protein